MSDKYRERDPGAVSDNSRPVGFPCDCHYLHEARDRAVIHYQSLGTNPQLDTLYVSLDSLVTL